MLESPEEINNVLATSTLAPPVLATVKKPKRKDGGEARKQLNKDIIIRQKYRPAARVKSVEIKHNKTHKKRSTRQQKCAPKEIEKPYSSRVRKKLIWQKYRV